MKETVAHLSAALDELKLAEQSEDCAWCRSHIRELRVLCEDMIALARMGEGADVSEFTRRAGALLEKVGALSVMARIMHRVKGVEWSR